MSFIFPADDDMKFATLDFLDPAWNLGQTDFFSLDGYPNIDDFGKSAPNQLSPKMETDIEMAHFSFQPEQLLYQLNGRPTRAPHFASNETETLSVDLMSFEIGTQRLEIVPTSLLNNVEQRHTVLKYGQISPDTSPEEINQIPELRDSSSTEEQKEGNTSSLQEKRPPIGKPTVHTTANDSVARTGRKQYKSKKTPLTKEQEQAKRKQLLERNRKAANKCRYNRKKWTDFLQQKCYEYKADNNLKKAELHTMDDEVIQLKSMLMMLSQCHMDEQMQAWVKKEMDRSQQHPVGVGKKDCLTPESLLDGTFSTGLSSSIGDLTPAGIGGSD